MKNGSSARTRVYSTGGRGRQGSKQKRKEEERPIMVEDTPPSVALPWRVAIRHNGPNAAYKEQAVSGGVSRARMRVVEG